MPKKKKIKPVDRDDSGAKAINVSAASGGDGMISSPGDADSKEEEIRTQELRYLQDMFEGKLDPVVVHMIMNDCEFKVEAALETLFKLVDQTTAFESSMSILSGFKDVYIPKTEMEENVEADGGEDLDEESPFPDRADLHVRQPQTRNTHRFENYGNREFPRRNLRNTDDSESESVQLYSKDAAPSPVSVVTRQGVLYENDPSESRGGTQDTLSGHTVMARGPNSPVNDLSKTEASRAVKSSRDDQIQSKSDLPLERKRTESSSHNMNIHHDAALPRSQMAKAGSRGIRKTPQRPRSSLRNQDRLSSFRKSDRNLGGDISASEARTTCQDPSSTSADTAMSGSSPVNPASDDLEKHFNDMEMRPDMASASTENVEPSVIGNQDEYLNCPINAGQCMINPDGTRNEIDSDQQNKILASHNIETERSDHQPSQIRMEGGTENRGAASPDFFQKSCTRSPSPGPLGPQYPPSRFPPRFYNRMPRPKPAGRASVLQRHLRPHDPQVSRPFFTPIPRGVDTRRESPSHHTEYPVQNFQPPQFTRTDGGFCQPNSKTQSTVPPWLQKQERSQHNFPSFSNPKYQTFSQRSISPVHGQTFEGVKLPPDGLNTSSSLPNYTNHTPWVQARGKRRAGFEDKVIPLPEGKVLCLMRGCPGSGKSTLARKLVGQGRVLSSDDYFITNGKYRFDVTKLSDAHDWSHKRCQDVMKSGVTPIIIDNTNIERWTMKPYVVMALKHGYMVEFREPTTPWKFNLGKLNQYNTHNVPKDRIRLMIERFERNVSVENILGSSKPHKLKTVERDRYMFSAKNERRMHEQEEDSLQLGGVSGDGDVGESERMTPRKHKEEDDSITDYKKEGEDVFNERYQTTVEETPTPVAKALDADEEPEESQSEDEMFVSDAENGIDAMMESLAEFSEVNETPLMTSCELSRSCEDRPSASEKNDIKEDEQKKVDFVATVNLVATASPLPCLENTQEGRVESIGDDDFVAMVNLEAGASCVLLPENTQEDGGRDDRRIESIVDDDFEAVMNSITQASRQPTIKLLSTNQSLGPTAEQEEVIVETKEENVDNEDEFVKIMNLEVGGSSVQYVDEHLNEKHQDDSGKDEDNFKTETTLVQACSPNEEQPDNIGKDQKMEDDAGMVTLIEEASLDPSEGQTRPQDSPNEAEDKKEDNDDFSAMMNEVADAAFQLSHELTAIEEEENLDNSKKWESGEVVDNIRQDEAALNSAVEDLTMVTAEGQKPVTDICNSSSPESEPNPNPVSANLTIDSAAQDSTGGDEVLELKHEKCSVQDKVTEEEGESDPIKTGADCSYFKELTKDGQTSQTTEDQTSASKQKNYDETGEKVRPPTQEFMNDNFQVAVSERQLETSLSESNMFIGDINSNLMSGVKQGEEITATSPSCLSHHELCNQRSIPVSTQSTPSPSVTPRSQSPCLQMSPLSHDENAAQQCHEKRKLRRSKSHGKGTRMAAVFPKLSPGRVNWLELASSVKNLEGEMTPEKPLISSVDLECISFTDVGTNTLAVHFSCLQRLGSGKLTVEDVQCQGFVVVTGQARQLSVLNQSDETTTNEYNSQHDSESLALNSSQDRSPIPASVKLHKSTMTDHERQSENTDNNLANLITLFPSVPQNDLEDILARCTGDLEWATNILLDDLGNGEKGAPKIKPDLGKAGGSLNPNKLEVVPSGSATNHSDDNEEQEMTSNQECLQSKPDIQTSNLASSMISVVDDILKSISSENIESATSSTPLEKSSSDENGERQSTVTGQYLEKLDDLFQELDPKNLNVDFAPQDSTRTISSRNSNFEQELLQAHERLLQHDKDTTVKMNISKIEEQTLIDVDFTGEKPETSTESSVLEDSGPGPGPMDTLVSTGSSSKTTPDEDKNELDFHNILEGPTLEATCTVEHQHLDKPLNQIEPSSTVPEIKQDLFQKTVNDFRQSPESDRPKEQDVRPKTPSRSASKRPPSKPSRREGRDTDLHERMKRDPSRAANPLRRDAFEAAGGVQFSWNHQSEAEFSVPHPEQMMTGCRETIEMGDGEVVTDEKAEFSIQAHSVRMKKKELSSLKEGLMLQLDAAFALQLQEMFGSAGFYLLPDGLPAEDLQVHVDYDLAKQLHSLWSQTLQTRFNQEEELDNIITADEELARRLQQEEDINHMAKVQSSRSAKYQGPKASPNRAKQPISSHVGYGDSRGMMDAFVSPGQQAEETKGLQEIMDEELAAQVSKDVEDEEKVNTDGFVSLATKLKRDKLFNEFSNVDRDTLEDIFRANNFQLEPTIKQVQSFFILASGPPKDVYTNEALERMERQLIEQAERESLASSSEGTDDSSAQESYYQSVRHPDYQDYRAEATQHYRQRHEAFQKAAAAYKQGQKDLASFYSQQGHLHTEKLKAANKRAAEVILSSKNSLFSDNTLDLHGLHVDEALLMLNQVLSEKTDELEAYDQQPHPQVSKSPPRHMFIITGKGNHSRGGVARIRPAVTELLKREGYRFSLQNAGLIKVSL